MDDETMEEPSRDVMTTLARWSRQASGYIAVCNRITGDVVEIAYREATTVWKEDIRRLKR